MSCSLVSLALSCLTFFQVRPSLSSDRLLQDRLFFCRLVLSSRPLRHFVTKPDSSDSRPWPFSFFQDSRQTGLVIIRLSRSGAGPSCPLSRYSIRLRPGWVRLFAQRQQTRLQSSSRFSGYALVIVQGSRPDRALRNRFQPGLQAPPGAPAGQASGSDQGQLQGQVALALSASGPSGCSSAPSFFRLIKSRHQAPVLQGLSSGTDSVLCRHWAHHLGHPVRLFCHCLIVIKSQALAGLRVRVGQASRQALSGQAFQGQVQAFVRFFVPLCRFPTVKHQANNSSSLFQVQLLSILGSAHQGFVVQALSSSRLTLGTQVWLHFHFWLVGSSSGLSSRAFRRARRPLSGSGADSARGWPARCSGFVAPGPSSGWVEQVRSGQSSSGICQLCRQARPFVRSGRPSSLSAFWTRLHHFRVRHWTGSDLVLSSSGLVVFV